MSLLLLLRNHQSGGVTPPVVGEDEGHHPGGELLWPAQGQMVPPKPNIPIRLIGKPKKLIDTDDEDELLLLLEGFYDD